MTLSPSSAGILMAAPVLVLVAVFTLYPVGRALYQSMHIESPIFPSRFVGLQNYQNVLGGRYFTDAAWTTLRFAAVTVPLLVALGVLTALLLNESFVGNTLLRVGMILPWALPATVAGLIWKWVFLDSWGALNAGLYTAGFIDNYVAWLTTPRLAQMAVIVVFIWTQLPLTAVFLLAALQAVPAELYDAAAVDGAGVFGRFWNITLPGIRPMLVIVALYETLMAITNFDIVYALTQGGPGTATTMLTYFTWVESFKKLDFGVGSALAVLIALGSLVVILILVRAIPKGALVEERA
ncbi:MAG: sugar ABC transporter permease [Chloroflexota bacterium]|nr:sugar ABC transporter permease [Chloroflexota bacterium]